MDNTSTAINVKKMKIKLKKNIVISDLSFDLKQGEILAMVGGTPFEKSTIAKAISGNLYKPFKLSSNEIKISHDDDYSNIELMKKRHINKKVKGNVVAYISSRTITSIAPNMKIVNQLLQIASLNPQLKGKDKTMSKINEFLNLVNFKVKGKIMNFVTSNLSEFEVMKIALVKALLLEPKVIILDSISKNIAVKTQSELLRIIKKINVELNCSIIIFTNSLRIVSQIATRINILFAGKLLESGKTAEVIKKPQHPYTWDIIAACTSPMAESQDDSNYINDGSKVFRGSRAGDPYAKYNKFALEIDFKLAPPWMKVSKTHFASTWLLDPASPKVKIPDRTKKGIKVLERLIKE